MKIDIKTVKQLAEHIDKYNLKEVALESEGIKLVLKKELERMEPIKQPVITTKNTISTQKSVDIHGTINCDKETVISPMTGTFYKSSAPGLLPLVQVGDKVKVGDTLCIIEAMKLMNEVKSVRNCIVTKIFVKDGQSVKKGDKLFEIA